MGAGKFGVVGFGRPGKSGVQNLGEISDKLWIELGTPTQPQCKIKPPSVSPPREPLHKRKNRAWVSFYKLLGEQETLENKLWACERQLDKLRDKRAGFWQECKVMQAKVGAGRAEVDKLFGAAEVDHKLAGVEKLDVEGLGKVEVDMDDRAGWGGKGTAEVYRMDTDEGEGNVGEWLEAEAYAVEVGGAWGGAGSGSSTPGKGGDGDADGDGLADGADLAVEQYWESRGNAPSEATDLGVLGAEEFDYDGAGGEDADMWADLAVAEVEDSGVVKSWSEELQSKKRRTEAELQKVRDLHKVRKVAFKKG